MSIIQVLDHGFVRLDRHSGDDLSIVNHARISLAKHKEVMEEADEKLISFLMKHRHGTPFESVFFSFHVRAPIAVTREWMRHRIASYNEMSARYVKMKMDFYLPEGEYIRTQTGKPGHYEFKPMKESMRFAVQDEFWNAYDACEASYENMLAMGVAKELARFVLPVGLYTEFYFDTNARSLMNFLSLRNHESALKEIRQYGQAIEEMFAKVAPVCYNAFIQNGRTAP
jgi:thymidylate synthase (FAD)